MTYKEEQQIKQGRPIFGLGCCLKKLGKKSSQKTNVSTDHLKIDSDGAAQIPRGERILSTFSLPIFRHQPRSGLFIIYTTSFLVSCASSFFSDLICLFRGGPTK